MNEPTIRELREENRQLRTLVESMNATLLRKIAVESVTHRPLDSADAARLVREAEDCFRFARLPGLKSEIAEGLEVAGHELMAKAVEIETGLQHAKKKGSAATQPWGDGLEGHARVLLQLSHSCKESASAEEMRKIAYALLDLARNGA